MASLLQRITEDLGDGVDILATQLTSINLDLETATPVKVGNAEGFFLSKEKMDALMLVLLRSRGALSLISDVSETMRKLRAEVEAQKRDPRALGTTGRLTLERLVKEK